ncbi:transcription factor tfiiib component [Metarhizium rileyi]|uniref:Transcription factor tfiiib component n=1 Tax=Metarhizium rileyi (strain RCEF 4871) TaxID=1649241 RepID=A0A166ZLV3_METRR|nr:transcription factor tfiiib component [Metarhizium rileyi RCEF 4871]TWU76700.1 Transcription factor TFIIIB component B [Metarhizium rileyi]
MSSMFKKKGGLAFKPKAPVARPRTGTSAPTTNTAPPPQPTLQPAIDDTLGTREEAESGSAEKETDTSGSTRELPQTAAQEPTVHQNDTPVTPSRRATRRASQLESSSRPQIQTETPPSIREILESAPIAEPSEADAPARQPAPRTRRKSAAKPPSPKLSTETTELSASPEGNVISKTTKSAAGTKTPFATASEEPAAASRAVETRATTRRRSVTAAGEATASAAEGEPPRPKKRQRKTSREDTGTETPVRRKRKTSTPKANVSRSSSRRARSLTPDDAEDQVVDLQKLKMSDLTRDLRIGKKFSRHDELRERERKARLKAKPDKDGDTTSEAGNDSTQSPAPNSANSTTPKPNSDTATPSAAAAAPSGPQFRIVDGQIVVDQSSLVMDRHARAAAARANEDMETIEENDFTRLITSSSFMNTSKLKGPNVWTEPETELFYRGLRMFGTEFEMISKMFPGKQRRHVKLKFNREERHNPGRIDAALIGEKTIKIDIDEYRAFTGAEYESVEAIEAEQRKIQEGYEAERQRVVDEQAEIMRKKKEELFADEDGENGASKKKGKRKKGKQTVQYGLNGEPITAD